MSDRDEHNVAKQKETPFYLAALLSKVKGA